jgi:hypothetical protein
MSREAAGVWVDPRAGVNVMEKRAPVVHAENRTPIPRSSYLVAKTTQKYVCNDIILAEILNKRCLHLN